MSRRKNAPEKLKITKGPPRVRWTDRNSMAWKAFHYLLIGTVVYWFALPVWINYIGINSTFLSLIGESYNWFAMTMSAIILGYMGFTTLPFLGSRRRVITDRSEEDQNDIYMQDGIDMEVDEDKEIVVDKNVFMKAVAERDDETDDNEIKDGDPAN